MEDGSISVLTDSELLARYCSEGDQLAFAELVNRYEPMVLRVCRQVLAGCSAAEDVSQQVFVALSVKAGDLLDRESVSSWLYRAAWNIASRTRRAACVRKAHEQSAASRMPMYAPVETTEPDTQLILHEALAEIPDIYREAIVLHYYCGHSVAECAAKLRCPTGTAAARVSRGLERMRSILSARGLLLSALGIKMLMMDLLTRTTAAATIPPAMPLAVPGPSFQLPRAGRSVFRAKVWQTAWALGLLPMSLGFRASGGTPPWKTTGIAGGLAAQFNAFKANSWSLKTFYSMAKWKQALACLLLGLSTMGAGSAAAKVVAPDSWLAKLPDKLVAKTVGSDPVQSAIDGFSSPGSSSNSPGHSNGFGTASTAVPEPGSMSLLLIGATIALRRRAGLSSARARATGAGTPRLSLKQ